MPVALRLSPTTLFQISICLDNIVINSYDCCMTSACAHLVSFSLRVALGQVTEATFATNANRATSFDAIRRLGARRLLNVWPQGDHYCLQYTFHGPALISDCT